MKADLHVHSTASDGTLTASELVSLALSRGLSVLAIADHDSVAGVPAALSEAQSTSLTVVPAVELSSVEGTRDVHVLGYYIRHDDPNLHEHLNDLRDARLRRAMAMVDQLSDAGFKLEMSDVLDIAGQGSVGRAHVARALVRAGHAESIRDAFNRLIGRGRDFYVRQDVRPPKDVIATIIAAGGLPVLAHPGVNGLDDLIPALVEAGLGGIEAFHADHSAEQRAHYAEVARSLDMLVTGGSDFHGEGAPNPDVGTVAIPVSDIERLLEWGAQRQA